MLLTSSSLSPPVSHLITYSWNFVSLFRSFFFLSFSSSPRVKQQKPVRGCHTHTHLSTVEPEKKRSNNREPALTSENNNNITTIAFSFPPHHFFCTLSELLFPLISQSRMLKYSSKIELRLTCCGDKGQE